jgi:hypothetical protein
LQPDSEIKNSPRTSNPPTDNGARNLGVISRFHTPVEQQCLRIFLQGPRIVICPARGLDRFLLPAEWQQKFKRGELLIVNPFDSISAFFVSERRSSKRQRLTPPRPQSFAAGVSHQMAATELPAMQ